MDKHLLKRSSKALIGLGAGAALWAVCPPAALGLGAVAFVRSARRLANGGGIEAMRDLGMSYIDLSSGASSAGRGRGASGHRH